MIERSAPEPSHQPGDTELLKRKVQLLVEFTLFDQVRTEVHRSRNRPCDAEYLRQLGLIMHGSALRANAGGRSYGAARALYFAAARSTEDLLLKADVITRVGISYFDEGRIHLAVRALEISRSIAPWRHHAHLGLLTVACATRDLLSIYLRCNGLIVDIPRWYEDRELVTSLATDPNFAILRSSPRMFLACFGGHPDDLRALHDRYCFEELTIATAYATIGPLELDRVATTSGARRAGP